MKNAKISQGAFQTHESAWVFYYDSEGEVQRSRVADGCGNWSVSGSADSGIIRAENQQLGFAFQLQSTRQDDVLTVTLPADSLMENGDARWQGIVIYPGFVAGNHDDGGMLVLPWEHGGICRNKQKLPAEYLISVYNSRHPVRGNMPIFGAINSGEAILGIVEEGQFDLSLLIRTNWGEEAIYAADPFFAFRDLCREPLQRTDCQIRYQHLHGKEASPGGIARAYRRYNLETRQLPTLKEKCKNNPDLQFASEAISIRCRMAFKQLPTPMLEQCADQQPPMTIFMTFENVRRLIEACAQANIRPAEFNLVGWNYAGHDGAFPQLFPVEPQLGGEEKLRELIVRAGESGYPLSLHDNYFDAYSLADNFDPDTLCLDVDGHRRIGGGDLSGGRAYLLCAEAALQYAKNSLPQVAKLGVRGSYYCDVLSIAGLQKCFHPQHPLTRQGTAQYRKKILAEMQKQFHVAYSEGARDWALPELDRAYAIGTCEQAALPFYDEEFPLFEMVYHGFLIYNSSRAAVNTFPGDEPYLRNLAYGGIALVYFHHLFHPEWGRKDGWSHDVRFGTDEELQKTIRKLQQVSADQTHLAGLSGEFIEDFIRHGEWLTETIFSNGERLFVNFGSEPVSAPDGKEVASRNFRRG